MVNLEEERRRFVVEPVVIAVQNMCGQQAQGFRPVERRLHEQPARLQPALAVAGEDEEAAPSATTGADHHGGGHGRGEGAKLVPDLDLEIDGAGGEAHIEARRLAPVEHHVFIAAFDLVTEAVLEPAIGVSPVGAPLGFRV